MRTWVRTSQTVSSFVARCSAGATIAPENPPLKSAAAPADSTVSGTTTDSKEDAAVKKETLIAFILGQDREIFQLKRQHELSLRRIEQNQARLMRSFDEKQMYKEQTIATHVLEVTTTQKHNQRYKYFHVEREKRLRYAKMALTTAGFAIFWVALYHLYAGGDDKLYVRDPRDVIYGGQLSQYKQLMAEREAKRDEERLLKEQERLHEKVLAERADRKAA